MPLPGGAFSLPSDWLCQTLVVSGTLMLLPGLTRLHFVRDGAATPLQMVCFILMQDAATRALDFARVAVSVT